MSVSKLSVAVAGSCSGQKDVDRTKNVCDQNERCCGCCSGQTEGRI